MASAILVPSFRTAVQLTAIDDLDDPADGALSGTSHARSLITGIGENAQDERSQRERVFVEHERRGGGKSFGSTFHWVACPQHDRDWLTE